jgi:hypothetical protein
LGQGHLRFAALMILTFLQIPFLPVSIKVIRSRPFDDQCRYHIRFAGGMRLGKIGEEAFAGFTLPMVFTAPSSLKIFSDRCFAGCRKTTIITFKDDSRLQKIAERAFFECRMRWIAIPALVEEIGGSGFVGFIVML